MASTHKSIMLVTSVILLCLPAVSGDDDFFYYKGLALTADQRHIKMCMNALTVKEGLVKFMEDPDVGEGSAESMYRTLFNNEGDFDYQSCTLWCGAACGVKRKDFESRDSDQCVKTIAPYSKAIAGLYVCCCNIFKFFPVPGVNPHDQSPTPILLAPDPDDQNPETLDAPEPSD